MSIIFLSIFITPGIEINNMMCGSVYPLITQFLTGYPENLNVIQPIHTGWSKTIIKIIRD